MDWIVNLHRRIDKNRVDLPKKIEIIFQALLKELEADGPIRANWPNFGKIEGTKKSKEKYYHCHLKRGKPRYVAVWKIVNKEERILEVTYVGTHEKVEYSRLC